MPKACKLSVLNTGLLEQVTHNTRCTFPLQTPQSAMSAVEHGAPGNVLLEVLSRGMYDQETWERTAAILSEITNHSAKENTPQLEHANSGSLQPRGSSSAVMLPDGHDTSNKHMGRIPHSAYMCTDTKQNHAAAMQASPAPDICALNTHPHYMHQQAAPKAEAHASWKMHATANRKVMADKLALPSQHSGTCSSPQRNTKGAAVVVEPVTDGDWPAHITVQCNGNVGKFMLGKQSMVCMCKVCQAKAAKANLPYSEMTPTEFERHSGMILPMTQPCNRAVLSESKADNVTTQTLQCLAAVNSTMHTGRCRQT